MSKSPTTRSYYDYDGSVSSYDGTVDQASDLEGNYWDQDELLESTRHAHPNSGHQVDCSCLHCCPQDWHISAPMHPYVCCNKNEYPAHPNQRCYDLYQSSPSSPRHYTGSEFSVWSCDGKSDDSLACKSKKSSKERHHLVKRHVRPVAGGAPFLICYGCSELLQVPAEFLLFRRRCHQLKCSACSVTLKFSLQNETHIVQYTDFNPDAVAPFTQ